MKKLMTQDQIEKNLAADCGVSQTQARNLIKRLIIHLRGQVESVGSFRLVDLGTFKLRHRQERTVHLGGIPRHVPAHQNIAFRPAANFKRALNRK